jgi:asparagine synthase (glutamine-hydrolysing)
MILHLSELISRAVEQTLEDKITIAFSGGVDSSVIATIAKKHVQVELFTAGVPGSEDLEVAEVVASQLGLPLHKVSISEDSLLQTYEKCHKILPLELIKLEIFVPVYYVAEAAASKGHKVMLFGTAAEELFVGYERYYTYKEEGKDVDAILKDEFKTLPQRDIGWVKKVCRYFDIEARFPFYNKDLAEAMFSVPIEERMDDYELKKTALRDAAKVLGVPEIAFKRRKRAMQYGSGVHKLLIKHADEINAKYSSK